ncbi:MAG: hypothetical protein K2K82_03855 [Muribaculaceae bacterium]|nr:hypothetical protein [Muribaculaceae bacterium]
MKKLLLVLCIAASAAIGRGQAYDTKAIAASPYIAENSGVPASAENVLETKLRNLINSSGMVSDPNQRFILTAKVNPLTEDVTPTTPPKYVYTLSLNLYFGDGISGKLFSSSSFETKGVGNTKEKAYLAAIRALSPNDPALKTMLNEAQENVIEYYLSQGPSIIKQAEAAMKTQNYDEAFFLLDQIPSACPALFAQANNLKMKVYETLITEEGNRELAEARAIWNAGQDREAADRAGEILARINPQSHAYKEAQALHSQIAARVKAIDNREWNLTLQKQKDDTAVKKASLQAAKEIAVAQAKNQPKTVYRVYWW